MSLLGVWTHHRGAWQVLVEGAEVKGIQAGETDAERVLPQHAGAVRV